MKLDRTTIVLQKPLLTKLRQLSRQRGVPLSSFIALLIQEGLRCLNAVPDKSYEFEPVIIHGTKPPAIDISDRDALYGVIDEKTSRLYGERKH